MLSLNIYNIAQVIWYIDVRVVNIFLKQYILHVPILDDNFTPITLRIDHCQYRYVSAIADTNTYRPICTAINYYFEPGIS